MAEKNHPTKSKSELDREDRLKAALKANMSRRKAQAKARAAKNNDTENGPDTSR